MNITVEQLENRLTEVREEFFHVEALFNDNPLPDSALLEKLVQLLHTIELLEEEIDRRSTT